MRTKILALSIAATLAAAFAIADTSTPAKTAPAADLVQKAELLAARQSWPAAIDAFKQAIKESPKDAALHNRLGICYQGAGDAKRAKKEYKRAVALRPSYAEAWNNLGTLEQARNRYKDAISLYAKAVQLKSGDAVLYRNLGAAWMALGDMEKAAAAWSDAYRADPAFLDGPGVAVRAGSLNLAREYYLYAKLLAARGQTENALDYLSKAHAQGFHDFARIEGDKDFAGLVADPRYAALK